MIQLAEALSEGDAGKGLSLINSAFEAGDDPRQINRQLVDLLRAIMFQVASNKTGGDPASRSWPSGFTCGRCPAFVSLQ